MGNIAERLLILAGNINLRPEESELCADAAEEIERLRSRVAELEASVQQRDAYLKLTQFCYQTLSEVAKSRDKLEEVLKLEQLTAGAAEETHDKFRQAVATYVELRDAPEEEVAERQP